jgi:hypothetical protein
MSPRECRVVNNTGPLVWHNSYGFCALVDDERHLGHVIRIDKEWSAFDGTHLTADSTGFVLLGTSRNLSKAKELIERNVVEAILPEPLSTGFEEWSPSVLPAAAVNSLRDQLEAIVALATLATGRGEWKEARHLMRQLVKATEAAGLATSQPMVWAALINNTRKAGRAIASQDRTAATISLRRYWSVIQVLNIKVLMKEELM